MQTETVTLSFLVRALKFKNNSDQSSPIKEMNILKIPFNFTWTVLDINP